MKSTQNIADRLTKEKQFNQVAYYMAYCNSDLFDNASKKRQRINTIKDIAGGLLLFGLLAIASYFILNTF